MSLIKVTRKSRAKFHCNRLTTVVDIQDYASLIFWITLYLQIWLPVMLSVRRSKVKV